ncbi:MAG: hypothetical protein RLZZ600_1151 [Actinomycetota bacterium]|jgi:hypothetical protein
MSAQNDKVEKRTKIFTLVSALAACLAIMAGAGLTALSGLLNLQVSESTGYALFILLYLPLVLITSVFGILALLYNVRNPLWRGGRIAVFALAVIAVCLVIAPLLFQMLVHSLPLPK